MKGKMNAETAEIVFHFLVWPKDLRVLAMEYPLIALVAASRPTSEYIRTGLRKIWLD
jgi:hypothetical protein